MQIVKSDTATARVPELDFEIPPLTQRGSITTLEGLLGDAADNLRALQEQRHKADPDTAKAIDAFLDNLQQCCAGQQAFTFVLDDPAGNSFIESPDGNARADTALQICHYERTREQATAVGLSVPDSDGPEAAPAQVRSMMSMLLRCPTSASVHQCNMGDLLSSTAFQGLTCLVLSAQIQKMA